MRLITEKRDLRECKICGKKSRCISRKGYCEKCSLNVMKSSILQLSTHKGEIYDKWKKNLKKSLGIDDE